MFPDLAVEFKDAKAPRKEGAFIVRSGLYFRCGDYPDKQFALTPAEADSAIKQFTPAPLNVEHIPSLFDGKLGTIRTIWRDGNDINAEYAIPSWLHDVTEGQPIKVSSEWNRTTKTAIGGALVLNPRVQDAAFTAAFSHVPEVVGMASQAHTDKMQRIHDQTCDMGAECGGKSYMSTVVAEFLTKDQLKTVQKLHDLTATFDDCCNRYQTKAGMYGAYYSENHPEAEKDAGKGNKSMFEGLKKLFTRAGVPQSEIDAAFSEEDKPAVGTTVAGELRRYDPPPAQMSEADKARFARMEADVIAANAKALALEAAATFADHKAEITTLQRVYKLTPAEADEWRKIAQENPTAFTAALPALKAREPLPQIKGNTVTAAKTADTDKLQTLTSARIKETGERYDVAFKAVCAQNPDIAAAVRMDAQEGR